MHVFTWDGFTPLPAELQRSVVTIGNFDGVHRGHAALLRRLIRLKERLQCPARVVTFDPSPTSILRPHLLIEQLSTLAERLKLFSRYPIDSVVVLKSSLELLNLDAPVFWNEILCKQLQIKGMVEGRNFCFGKDRLGTIDQLEQWCSAAGIPLEIVDDVYRHGMRVSSSAIRAALHQGDVTVARYGLGRCYSITGTVVHGDHRGRTIGFPTCNLAQIATLIPLEGVYAARAVVDEKTYVAAVNVGPNPTFGIAERKVEAHLLDFDSDLYGKQVTLEFVARLRGTQRFASVQELQQQLNTDIITTRKLVQEYQEKQRHGSR